VAILEYNTQTVLLTPKIDLHLPVRMSQAQLGSISWERMIRAVERVRQRLDRAVAALKGAGIPYAVAGGNAVAAWVSRVDEAAVRNTQDVDVLLRRTDLERAKSALTDAGFVFRHVKSIDMFLDGPNAKARDAIHVVFAGEKVKTDSLVASPIDSSWPTRFPPELAARLQTLLDNPDS
jgi:hypothetical protein